MRAVIRHDLSFLNAIKSRPRSENLRPSWLQLGLRGISKDLPVFAESAAKDGIVSRSATQSEERGFPKFNFHYCNLPSSWRKGVEKKRRSAFK